MLTADMPWVLTPRQIELLDLLCELGTQKAVARQLDISPKTVETHLGRVREAMGVKTMLPAVLKWDRWRRAQEATSC